MTHTYKITGMSCSGCRTKVKKALNTIEGVSATVTLDPSVATITMEKHIPTEQLQAALNKVGNFTLEMAKPLPSTTNPAAKTQMELHDHHAHHQPRIRGLCL